MTKAELIEALKDFPDDMQVCLEVNGGMNELTIIEYDKWEYWISNPLPLDDDYINDRVILLRGQR